MPAFANRFCHGTGPGLARSRRPCARRESAHASASGIRLRARPVAEEVWPPPGGHPAGICRCAHRSPTISILLRVSLAAHLLEGKEQTQVGAVLRSRRG